jgi:hypothetical protein
MLYSELSVLMRFFTMTTAVLSISQQGAFISSFVFSEPKSGKMDGLS